MRKNACCFTGHREIPSEDREPLRAALLSEIQRLYAEKGVTEFYTGGARGFDTMAAEEPAVALFVDFLKQNERGIVR